MNRFSEEARILLFRLGLEENRYAETDLVVEFEVPHTASPKDVEEIKTEAFKVFDQKVGECHRKGGFLLGRYACIQILGTRGRNPANEFALSGRVLIKL